MLGARIDVIQPQIRYIISASARQKKNDDSCG